MSTKIDLKYPYNEDWKFGYIVINGEGRNTVILFNDSYDRSSTSYARYLMSVHLKRYLEDDEHVDHIDDDKTNDILENLQIISRKENNIKHCRIKGRLLVEYKCPICEIRFTRRRQNSNRVESKKNLIITCSNKCKYILQTKSISETKRKQVIEWQFIREFSDHS